MNYFYARAAGLLGTVVVAITGCGGGDGGDSSSNNGGMGATGATTSSGGSSSGATATGGAAGSTASGGTGAANGGAGGTGAATSGGTGGVSGAGGGSSGSGTGGSLTGGLTLTIEPNPNSVVSCYVNWTTASPSDSRVQFGVGGYEWEIVDSAMVTQHRVLVIGMRASQNYQIQAISGSESGTGTFMTAALPALIPSGNVMINDAAKRQAGWTLINAQKGGPDNRPRSADPPMAVIYDEQGQVVWYHINEGGPDIGGAVSTQLTDKGVLIGPTWNMQTTNGIPPREVDFAGNTHWECTHAACLSGKNVTHEAVKLPNGHYVILEYIQAGTGQNPVFRELDADSREVWSLDWNQILPAPSGSTGDWCHANAITIDIERNEVYANCRWVGLLKTTYTNPTKQWLLPASYGSKGQGDITYSPTSIQFSDAHAPDFYPDTNTVIFYDNGGWSGSVDNSAGYHSRAIEYKITGTTATLEWEFPGDFNVTDTWYTQTWYSPFWGDADRLANGNVLVAAGHIGAGKESRVFEVARADGQLVWEMRLPQNYGVYRAERVTPPLVRKIGM